MSPPSTCPVSGHVLWRQYVAPRHGPGAARRGAGVYLSDLIDRDLSPPPSVIDWHAPTALLPIPPMMSDDQRQCQRGIITPDVELGAALALADMAGSGAQAQAKAVPVRMHTAGADEAAMTTDDDEMASTRLSLQLGRVGIQSSSCSSGGSSAGRRTPRQPAPAAAHGPRPRHQVLTEVTIDCRAR